MAGLIKIPVRIRDSAQDLSLLGLSCLDVLGGLSCLSSFSGLSCLSVLIGFSCLSSSPLAFLAFS